MPETDRNTPEPDTASSDRTSETWSRLIRGLGEPTDTTVPNLAATTSQEIDLVRAAFVALENARSAHRVQSSLPKLLNPLFRDQAGVNRSLMQSLGALNQTVEILVRNQESQAATINALVAGHNARTHEARSCAAAFRDFCTGVEIRVGALTEAVRTIDKQNSEMLVMIQESLHSLATEAAKQAKQLLKLNSEWENEVAVRSEQLGATSARLETAEQNLQKIEVAVAEVETGCGAALNEIRRETLDALEASRREIEKETVGRRELLDGLRKEVLQLRDTVARENTGERRLDELEGVIAELKAQMSSLHAAGRTVDSDILALSDATRRLSLEMETLWSGTGAQNAPSVGASQQFSRFYRDFEARFRGGRDLIRERVKPYVEHIRSALARTNLQTTVDLPGILDLGCGRGEWLEVLKEHNLYARGVDLNPEFVALCHSLELDVVRADAIQYVSQLPSDKLISVSCFHIVEHLPFPELTRLLAEIHRTLAPGGTMILETPNPANLLVSSREFYTDPTHLRPIPSSLLEFTVRHAGFESAEIVPKNPEPQSVHVEETSEVAKRWNRLFYGAQDYAIIAIKAS